MTSILRSMGMRLAILVVAFAAVPAILWSQFLRAEEGKRALLLNSVQAEGHLIAQALRLGLERGGAIASVAETRTVLSRIEPKGMKMRVLFQPVGSSSSVFLVAASPAVAPERLDVERRELMEAGIFGQVPASCEGAESLNVQYRPPSGKDEVLTSITPFYNRAGCWAIITSLSTADAVGSLLGRPYWQSKEVRLAALFYGLLGLLTLGLFTGTWRAVWRFGAQARAVASGSAPAGFAASNRMPELSGVAAEFDRMVDSLRASASAVRQAAEDNAHAFKTPIATISQALEPLRRGLPANDKAGRRSLQLIETSLSRLEVLVTAARRVDETIASLLTPPHEKIDLVRLSKEMLATYDDVVHDRGIKLVCEGRGNCRVWGGADLLETVIENIVENAIGFSPDGGTVTVRIIRQSEHVMMTVEDEGPGAPGEILATMFKRYVSHRPAVQRSEQHFGIGLWIVQRNVEAVGGTVHAENRGAGGLRVVVQLRAAD